MPLDMESYQPESRPRRPRSTQPTLAIGGRILVIDESLRGRQAYERILLQARLDVESTRDLAAAERALSCHGFDAVLASVSADDTSGLSIMRLVRSHDFDVPVILLAPAPSLEAASLAAEHGVWRYLSKPIERGELERSTWMAVRTHQATKARQGVRRRSLTPVRPPELGADLQAFTFERALAAVQIQYQPIVNHSHQVVFGHRGLLQSGDRVLSNAGTLLEVATRLGRRGQLDRSARALVARALPAMPADWSVLLALHDDDPGDDGPQMSGGLPGQCRRIILDVTLPMTGPGADRFAVHLQRLRGMGHPIALQHTGSGEALATLKRVAPDFLELSPAVIRGIDKRPAERAQLAALIGACRERGIEPMASGVNTPGEREALVELGVELMSGEVLPASPGPSTSWQGPAAGG
jgi:EAL domain-containing protein (putative c-di-GMP-specific phosphodiesterase class I)